MLVESFEKKRKKKKKMESQKAKKTNGRTGWEIVARSSLKFKLVELKS